MGQQQHEGYEPAMDDARIQAATGKGREAWFAILDAAGADQLAHRDIARLLGEEHEVPGWWAQTVTVEYERARGLRAKHETPGGFAISKSKTLRAPVEAVHHAWADADARTAWLDVDLDVSSATPHRSVNGRVGTGGRVAVWLTAKGEDRTQVSVSHEQLPDAETAEREKQAWTERLSRLAEALATP